MNRLRRYAILCLLFGSLTGLRAANFSFTGSFQYDTDLQFITFTVLTPMPNVTLRTWSYSGGTNAATTVIPSGGFEPYLNLYDSAGFQMNPGSSGPCTVPTTGNPVSDLLPDSVTGACADVYYPTSKSFPGGLWSAGTYTVVISLDANPGVGDLSQGFFSDAVLGLPSPSNYTCIAGSPGYQGTPPTVPVGNPFCDQWDPGVQRTGQWALDILNVDSASMPSAVPEPASVVLTLLGGAVLLNKRRRA